VPTESPEYGDNFSQNNKNMRLSSFMQVSENIAIKNKEFSKLSSMVQAMMMTQSNRSKKRYTEDGRPCASAFAQDGQTFFDCTSTRSPDGQNKNKEWCYVDASAKGDKPWDYCKPIMDYDKIREQNQAQMKEFTIKARKVAEEVEKNLGPGQTALDDLKRVKAGHAELDPKVNKLIREVTTLNNNLQNLQNTKSQWEKEEEKCVDIATKINEKRDKLKALETANKSKEMDKSDDTIKKEIASTKCSIAPWIQTRHLSSSNNCQGMLLYEEDPKGDGIIGQYFDNESFLGEFKEMKDDNIDFDWTGSAPIEGINLSNFSIRWEGFIYAPVTSMYQFAVESDDGASITLNNEIIVSHNMYTASSESKGRVDKWLTQEVEKKKNPAKNYNKSTSTPIKLTGGAKYKIVVSYYHSVHDDVIDNEKAFVKLYWQSEEFEERIVSKDYLYAQNAYPPLKLSGFTSEVGVVRKLHENDLAFKNSDQYIIRDIPSDFLGSTTIKLNSKYLDKELKFTSNIPVIVFLGRLAHYPNPVPNDFENTGEYMSLIQIPKPVSTSTGRTLYGARSGLIKIYKKKFDAGVIKIPLNDKSINIKGIPLILFFGFDTQVSSPISCGGEELWISDPTSKLFKDCSSSSALDNNWKCRGALNGKHKDTEGSTWAAKREGVGAWLKIEFKEMFQISKIKYKNRKNPAERNSIIVASFDNGTEFEMKLKDFDVLSEFIVDPPVRSSSIKFTIKEVYGTINNGGSFQVYGTRCIDPDEEKQPTIQANGLQKVAGINPKALPPLFKVADTKKITLLCKDSLSNSKKLDHIKQKPGNKVTIKCLDSCANSKAAIYGEDKYSKDSAICKAAFHSSKLKPEGGLVTIIFQGGETSYKGSVKNGIKSKNKGRSDISLTFESAEEKENIPMENGVKADVLKNGKWVPGIIQSIQRGFLFGRKLTITIEGAEASQKPFEMSYSKAYIKACGEKVRNRDCKGSRKNPNTNRPIKIKFVPNSYNKAGDWLLDKGELFGSHGKPYGWSKEMSSMIKTREGGSKPELDSLAEFPPSPLSKFCAKATPDVLCDKVTWSVKAGHGRFMVKLYVGDPMANTRLDLKVNDEYAVEGVTIPKGELKIYENQYDSVNEFITISSDCRNDCEYAMSKLNMIEIFPYSEEKPSKEDEVIPEKQDPCGNAIQGGRCEKGPDVSHCLYDDATAEGAKFCTGALLMMQVNKQYRCPSQREKFKCVKRQYKDQAECLNFCPGKCKKGKCL
jgi:hypothetical protein